MAGLYFHIPFCSQRCIYCDFYFVTTQKTHAGFVSALCAEIAYYADRYAAQEPIETVYFGGGTPSLLAAEDVHRILETARSRFDLGAVRETTFEINPEGVDLEYLRALRAFGVDRLSIGVQSFFPDDLRLLGRSHTAEEAAAIVPLARQAGFENLTLDLIFGLPDQPEEYWAANLERAVRLGAPHLSAYSLTVEEKTVLHKQIQRGALPAPDEETILRRFAFTMDYLRRHGYEQYEVSNYALPGRRAVHNSNYWNHSNYLGFGPSAHSFWRQGLPRPRAERWGNIANLKMYEALIAQRQLPLDTRDTLSHDQLANEYLMLRLRTSDGLDLDVYEQRYGVDLLVEKLDDLAWLEETGHIEPIRRHTLRLTDLGKTVCDAVTQRLLHGVTDASS